VLIVTSGIIDTINTTIPILPNDIPVIVDILEAILRYIAVHAYTYISIVCSCVIIYLTLYHHMIKALHT